MTLLRPYQDRVPLTGDDEIDIRQLFEEKDFGAGFTPELREQEKRVRADVASPEQ